MWTAWTRLVVLFLTLGMVHGCVAASPEPWAPLGRFECTPGAPVDCPCPLGGVGQTTCGANSASTTGPCVCSEVVLPSSDVDSPQASDAATNGGGGSDLLTGGTTPTEAGTSDTSVEPEIEEDTGPVEPAGGACVDQAQETEVQENLQSLEEDAWNQGSLCMTDNPANVAGCVQDAMIESHGLSSGCASCFAGYVVCIMSSCSSPCSNYDSPQCVACRTDNCIPAWQVCMGF